MCVVDRMHKLQRGFTACLSNALLTFSKGTYNDILTVRSLFEQWTKNTLNRLVKLPPFTNCNKLKTERTQTDNCSLAERTVAIQRMRFDSNKDNLIPRCPCARETDTGRRKCNVIMAETYVRRLPFAVGIGILFIGIKIKANA